MDYKDFFFFFFSFFTVVVLLFLLFLLNFSTTLESYDKGSSFECGFSSVSSLGVVFSMPFFVISIMFLLFDVEILVLCFYPFFVLSSYYLLYFFWFLLFVIMVSTLFEWKKGVLSWF
uniref:NADH-ubiquinone oxidoreductase chain 3 n=1 Tax=Histiostoma feroniarum TaxID=334618 RepID=A0A2Z4MAJ6_9ACAR|nr:NADH dehydrogenase subunit 3 [Histiostoma feroniarum]AWX53523.1 NADH dehydrogenase subunit 3 [Histiostoma feroniarum]